MYALTLWEPWASLMALGIKEVETRGWAPPDLKSGGEDLIVVTAAKRWSGLRVRNSQVRTWLRFRKTWPELDQVWAPFGRWSGTLSSGPPTLGCALSVHRLRGSVRNAPIRLPGWYMDVAAKEANLGDYSLGRYAWWMPVVHRLRTPIPVTGRQKLWKLPEDVAARIREEMEAAT